MDVKKRGRIIKYSVLCGMTLAGALYIFYPFTTPPKYTAWALYLVMIAFVWVLVLTPTRRRSPRQKAVLFLGPFFFGLVGGLGILLGHLVIGLLIGALIYVAGAVYAGIDLSKKCNSNTADDS
jgi:peptidoglycan/LPS O-acetylase OafA/YrhL